MSAFGFKRRYVRTKNVNTTDLVTQSFHQTIDESPTFVSKVSLGVLGVDTTQSQWWFVNPLDVKGDYAYFVSKEDDSFVVASIADPRAPVVLGTLTDGTYLNEAASVVVYGNYAYVTCKGGSARMTIIDITDKTTPIKAGEVTGLQECTKPIISGGYAYIGSTNNGYIYIVDISDPAAPLLMTTFNDNINIGISLQDIELVGDLLYVACFPNNTGFGLCIIDVSDKVTPVVLGSTNISVSGINGVIGGSGFAVVGSHVFITGRSTIFPSLVYPDTQSQLIVFNVDDPTNPVEVTHSTPFRITGFDAFHSAAVSFPYLYTSIENETSGSSGIARIDISDPADPVVSGIVSTTATDVSTMSLPMNLVLRGKYMYFGNATTTQTPFLSVFDISGNTFGATEIGNLKTGDLHVSRDVAVEGEVQASGGMTVYQSLGVIGGPFTIGKQAVTQGTSITTGVTINGSAGVITTVTATTAAVDTSTFAVTNSVVLPSSVVLATITDYSVDYFTNGNPVIDIDTIAAGSFNINIRNLHATNPLNGVLQISFLVV